MIKDVCMYGLKYKSDLICATQPDKHETQKYDEQTQDLRLKWGKKQRIEVKQRRPTFLEGARGFREIA